MRIVTSLSQRTSEQAREERCKHVGIPQNSQVKSEPIFDTPAESRAGDILLIALAVVGFWTLAYHLVLVARWPANTLPWCAIMIAGCGFALMWRVWKKTGS